MSAHGVGNLHIINGIIDKIVYLNILKNNLKQSAVKMGLSDSFKFYQDNDPRHKSYIVREWLLYNCANVIETPAQSSDLNLIENLWHELDKRIRKHTISNKEVLISKLKHEWSNISAEYTKKLVDSVPKRLQSVIKNKGLHTKY